jgi:hypothetical protein
MEYLLMVTDWKWQLFIFIKKSDVTSDIKWTIARILSDNGSLELPENEIKMFDGITGFSRDGKEPAVVYGIALTVKRGIKDAFMQFLEAYPEARYVVSANTDLVGYDDGELIATNFNVIPSGQTVTWEKAVNYLENEFGLVEIPKEDELSIEEAPTLLDRVVGWVRGVFGGAA